MTKRLWLVATMAGAFVGIGEMGCTGDTFTATTEGTGGTAATTTDGGGGQGGATVTTATGGAGGDGGGVGGGPGGTGGTSTTTTGQGGSGGGLVCQPLSDVCAQCAYGACEDLYCQCYAEMDCAQLVNCLQPCDPTDIPCQQPCLTDHQDSISKAFLLGDCAGGGCAAECMGVAVLGDCPKCLFTSCQSQMNACLADADCYEIVNCAIDCPAGDFSCALGCANGKPSTATNKALAVQSCMYQSCSNLCP